MNVSSTGSTQQVTNMTLAQAQQQVQQQQQQHHQQQQQQQQQQFAQNMSILQHQLTPQQLAALQNQQQVASHQQLGAVRPVVNIVGNQQNLQVLGANHQQGHAPISIITTGGQTYALASNLQTGITSHGGVPTQMHIRSLAPNAAAVVNQLQATQLAVQQVRANTNVQQARIQTIGASQNATPNQHVKQVQQVNLSLPLQGTTPSPAPLPNSTTSHNQILTKRKLQDLLREIDPTETLDDDVEEILLQIADDFIENVISTSCQIAKHRKSNTLEVKDVQLHLDRNWNMWIPGFGSEDLRPYKKLPSTEAHRQRLALIKKAMKK